MISELDYMGAKMKYFVSSDIHGYYDEWMKALGENGFDEKNPEHRVAFFSCLKFIAIQGRYGGIKIYYRLASL